MQQAQHRVLGLLAGVAYPDDLKVDGLGVPLIVLADEPDVHRAPGKQRPELAS